jgi:hypothetical protein
LALPLGAVDHMPLRVGGRRPAVSKVRAGKAAIDVPGPRMTVREKSARKMG